MSKQERITNVYTCDLCGALPHEWVHLETRSGPSTTLHADVCTDCLSKPISELMKHFATEGAAT
jgi:hypothetical protein